MRYSSFSKQRSFCWRRGFTVLEILILLGILLILAAVLFPVFFGRSRGGHPPPSCQAHLKMIGLGFKQYIQDYDERHPLVITGKSAFGWADSLQPYLKNVNVYQCPDETTAIQPTPNPTRPQYTDYWYNARLSSVSESRLNWISNIILCGDGNDGKDTTNARYHLTSIPQRWRNDTSSPLYRHQDEIGANFVFADGHAKWLAAKNWKNSESNLKFSFLLGGG